MAWPFDTIAPPSLDSGFVEVPTDLTAVASVGLTDQVYLEGMRFTNPTGGSIVVQVQDGAGNLVYQQTIPPGSPDPHEAPFEPITGLLWVADGAGLIGHIWGY